MDARDDLIGGAWLARQYGLELVAPLAVQSSIASRRATHRAARFRREEQPEIMRPPATLRGHLAFHLKHESVHLELLARVFDTCNPAEIEAWVRDEPTGQYARRAGFLYEWITGGRLAVPDTTAGAYHDAVDAGDVLAASAAPVNKRWRVRDNLPGTPAFCPTVRLEYVQAASALDVRATLEALQSEFGEDLLLRSAAWMTLRESKSSFAIEGEADQASRIQRFAGVLADRTGTEQAPLDSDTLADLQAAILGKDSALQAFRLRASPVFVGQTVRFQEVVHYIAPPAARIEPMLQGLQTFLARTTGASPVLRCAAAAFGFVYIHPLADGNGRVHRFLINDVLRRDGAVPAPLIVPVSAFIDSERAQRRRYDQVLDELSKPLMRVLAGHYAFGENHRYPDGVSSDLQLSQQGEGLALPAWRFPDLTAHAIYMADVIQRTITEDMLKQSQYLRGHQRAREAIKEILEMPDRLVDRVIRSVESGSGRLSGVLEAEIPALAAPGRWDAVVLAVRQAFADAPAPDEVEAYQPQRPAG